MTTLINEPQLIADSETNVFDENLLSSDGVKPMADVLLPSLDSGAVLQNGDLLGSGESRENIAFTHSQEYSDTGQAEDLLKFKSEHDTSGKVNIDNYDTHSDSIETLGEDASFEEDESLNTEFVSHINISKLGSVHSHKVKQDIDSGEQENATGRDSIIVLPELDSDNSQLDIHHETKKPESLMLLSEEPKWDDKLHRDDDLEVLLKENHPFDVKEQDKLKTGFSVLSKQTNSLTDGENLAKILPQGTIRRKGDLIEFVADDLQGKIRRSGPRSRTDSGSMGSRQSSMRSLNSECSSTSVSTSVATSSGLSHSPSTQFTQSPDDMPPIDPGAIFELENQARLVADNIDLMMGNLKTNLHKMSAITVGCLEAYRCSVDITCDSVDAGIKSMYALMAKCEELNKNLPPVYHVSTQISEIKRLLDLFEAQLVDKT